MTGVDLTRRHYFVCRFLSRAIYFYASSTINRSVASFGWVDRLFGQTPITPANARPILTAQTLRPKQAAGSGSRFPTPDKTNTSGGASEHHAPLPCLRPEPHIASEEETTW